ncbi:MAG: metallopeptidase [Candidatus Aenigmarchaeota archaeon]|nr:metallopeptidase [Candidatus Aenigmarchaeota archaeon]
MKFAPAPDIQVRIRKIVEFCEFVYINPDNLICMRSQKSKAHAYARIWSLPRIWQSALGVSAHYIIEVISEKFDVQSNEDQDRTLIHELMHIPKTFSGALVPHLCFGKRINAKSVETLYKKYVSRENNES